MLQAADSDELTQTGEIVGTVDYIAPEQAQNTKDADIRADIFSLGCTLFKLLAGRVPYEGDTTVERLTARLSGAAPSLRTPATCCRTRLRPARRTVSG